MLLNALPCAAGCAATPECAAQDPVGNDPYAGNSVTTADTYSPEAELNVIRSGVASFDPPRKMTRGVQDNVRLIIGAEQTVEQTESIATDGGDPVSLALQVGLWVCAELFATNFEINSDKVQCHNFGGGRFKSFNWDIVPQREGEHSLQVEVISYTQEDGDVVDSIPSESIDVTVAVDLPEKIDDGAQVISSIFGSMTNLLLSLAALLAAVGGVVWRYKRIGEKPDDI